MANLVDGTRDQGVKVFRLTGQQRAAVEARGVSIALSAGAGCGKTSVLTGRFLSLLSPGGTRLGELVAITFTDRAAREMRDRIRGQCQDRLLGADSPDEADHWLAILRDLEAARIGTIHSFCASLLRAHAVEAGVDPQFRTLDQTQASTLAAEVIDARLRELLAEQHDDVMDLIVAFGLERLKTMVRQLLGQRDKIDFADWRGQTADDILNRWQEFHAGHFIPSLMRELSGGEVAGGLLALLTDHEPENNVMQQRRDHLLERLPSLPGCDNVTAELKELHEQARVQGGGGKGVWPSVEVYEQVRDAASDLRDKIAGAQKLLEFDRSSARPAAEAGLQLLRVAEPIIAAYERRKAELGCLDFDDLMIRARDLLLDAGHERLRRQVAGGIKALLVDEFQDTDPLQVDLVKSLCGEGLARGKLFFVGDYKQSIYRFRRADPRVFRQLQQEVPPEGRLPLTRNFRSQSEVLAFANALFVEEFGPDYQPLESKRGQTGPTPAIEFLWAPAEDEKAENQRSIRRREARWIARRLKGMLESETILSADDGEQRRVRPGDVAILFRALSDVQYYEEALRQAGVDYYLVGGHAFYAQQEIFDLLNLLRSLASRLDEISLAGVLRSPFFSLSDETLFWLSQHPAGLAAGLFAAEPPDQLDGEARRRVKFAAETLDALRAKKDRLGIAALIEEALRLTGYDALLLGEFLGPRKLANLRKLIDQARGFDRSGIFTLADFITQLSEFVARQPDEPLAATLPENADVVRLMTIHQAKGLEFPVVVLPDLQRRTHGGWTDAAFHPELGPVVRATGLAPVNPDPKGASHDPVTGYELYQRMEADEDEQELIRLFYVGVTRAADRLILSSGVPRLGAAGSPWMRLLSQRFDLLTGELCRELPPGYGAPSIQVTTEEPPLSSRSVSSPRVKLSKVVAQAEELASSAAGEYHEPASIQPVPWDAAARREFSFSRLSGALYPATQADDDLHESDADFRPERVDALGLGTLVHDVLEEVDFHQPGDVREIVRRHASDHLENDAGEEQLALELVTRFIDSPRAAELRAASRVYKEIEFLLAWPPDGGADADASATYLRGYIDCLYEDAAGGWHLLDYKTNVVDPATQADVASKYEMQMLVYALAAQRTIGQLPTTIALHFLRTGTEHFFKLNEESRRSLVMMVNRAIAQLRGQATARTVVARDQKAAKELIQPWPTPPGNQGRSVQRFLPGF